MTVDEAKMSSARPRKTSKVQQPRKRDHVIHAATCSVCAFFLCSNTAFTQTLSYPNGYVTIGGMSGNYKGFNDEGSWQGKTINGALHFELGNNLNVQVSGRIADYSLGNGLYVAHREKGEQKVLSAAVFWRDPSLGLIGVFSESGEIDPWFSHYFTSIGIFGELYPNQFSTIGASLTSTDSNTDEVNPTITSSDLTYELWGEYFISNNLALRASVAHQVSQHNNDFVADWRENVIGVSGEYFLKGLSGTDASITAGYYRAHYSDSDRKSNEQIRIGLKWNFGNPSTLRDARRKGAAEMRYNNYIDVPRWWQFPR